MKMRGWDASLAALVTMAVSLANAGTNAWTETGPNVVAAYVRYSGNPSVVYARGGDKFWRSNDAGASWVVKRAGNTSEYAFAVNPANENLVVMQDQYYGLQRSIDGGDNFTFASTSNARVLKYGGASHRLYAISNN